MLESDEIWTVIDSYFRQQSLVRQQIESFHEFIYNVIPGVIARAPPVEITKEESHRITIKFDQAYLGAPQHKESNGDHCHATPNQCRTRGFSYTSPLFCDFVLQQELWNPATKTFEHNSTQYHQFTIANIPVMVGSDLCYLNRTTTKEAYENKECVFDQGGYFIVNGNEKVLIAQERMATNRIYVFNIKGEYNAEIRSINEQGGKSVSLINLTVQYDKRTGEPLFFWKFSCLKKEIPLFILFRALGITTNDTIFALLENDKEVIDMVLPSEEDSFYIKTQEDAYEYIASRFISPPRDEQSKQRALDRFITQDVLPHVSLKLEDNQVKCIYLALMVFKLCLCLLQRLTPDDRDNFGYKRLDLSASLLGNIFRSSFNRAHKNFRILIERKFNVPLDKDFSLKDEYDQISGKSITKDINFCMNTGNWTINRQSKNSKTGVSQALNRLAYMSSLSHLRRINASLAKEAKNPKPRQLHNSQFGIICCAETPEGDSCGLIKALAMMTDMSTETDPYIITTLVQNLVEYTPIQQISNAKGLDRVFVNGVMIALVHPSQTLRDKLVTLRRQGRIPYDISVNYFSAEQSLYIQTDNGRCIRPLFVVNDNQLTICKEDLTQLKDGTKTWLELVREGKIEYLDVLEAENARIASSLELLQTSDEFTHAEIHAAMIIGICASIIPMANHNQAPRNTYESSMCKQSMSIYSMNFQHRYDTQAHILLNPQKPLTPTKTMKYFGFEEMPAGQNVIVAIACFTGYNQEDSVLLNKAAVERGIFRSMYLKSITDQEVKKTGVSGEEFGKPNVSNVENKRKVKYNKIDASGFPDIGSVLKNGEVMIGKTTPTTFSAENSYYTNQEQSRYKRQDISYTVKSTSDITIDSVMVSENEIGKQLVKIRTRQIRIPEVGDKVASCNGQKGTCGLIIAQEDMPYTSAGITPDLIMNVHAIPSRMTIGQLLECVMSKTRCLTGEQFQSTAFESSNIDDVSALLHEAGFQKHGKEMMYHPATGKQMEALIFIGPTYYQRLKHMVSDKIHSRSRGPIHAHGRQPTEGRSKDGGFRFGEMERDVLIAHGAAGLLQEKLFTLSDKYLMPVCENCGLVCIKTKNKVSCSVCEDKGQPSVIEIPYACKLLFQELMAMNIAPRINVK